MLRTFVWVICLGGLLGVASLGLSQATETVSSVRLADGTEYFPVMMTDFAGEVLSFSAPNAIELGPEAIIQELINMNLARDAVIDERMVRLIPLKIVLDVGGGFVNLDGLNLQVLELTGDVAEVTLPEEGETTVSVTGNATLIVPKGRSVVLAEGTSSAKVTIDEALTQATTNPVTLEVSEGSSVRVEVRPY